RILVQSLHDKGAVVFYTMPGQANLDDRMQGYKNILTDHPQVKIVEVVNVKGDPRVAFDSTMEILNKGKLKPDAFVCLVSTACPEVADVLDRNKVSGKVVVAMDTDADTMQWVQKGLIAATIAQKPFTMAYYGIRMLDTLHHYKPQTLTGNWAQNTRSPVPVFIDTGATLIDKTNIAAFQRAQSSASTK
ncbi:MAG: substrate-binding domain-containing protein, partial [Bryobacteraceae bacterium]